MKVFSVLLLLLCSCGKDVCGDSYDFRTDQGVCVFLHGTEYTAEDLSQVINITEQEVHQYCPGKSISDLRDNYSDISITFVPPKSIERYGITYWENGLLVDDFQKIMVQSLERCKVLEILAHEFIHISRMIWLNKWKDTHPYDWFLDIEDLDNQSSVEANIVNRINNEICKGETNE